MEIKDLGYTITGCLSGLTGSLVHHLETARELKNDISSQYSYIWLINRFEAKDTLFKKMMFKLVNSQQISGPSYYGFMWGTTVGAFSGLATSLYANTEENKQGWEAFENALAGFVTGGFIGGVGSVGAALASRKLTSFYSTIVGLGASMLVGGVADYFISNTTAA